MSTKCINCDGEGEVDDTHPKWTQYIQEHDEMCKKLHSNCNEFEYPDTLVCPACMGTGEAKMKENRITKIHVDLRNPEHCPLSAGIVIQRGGRWSGNVKRYPATPANMRRIQGITSREGYTRPGHYKLVATWYRNIQQTIGVQHNGWLIFTINPDLSLTISLDPVWMSEIKAEYPGAFKPEEKFDIYAYFDRLKGKTEAQNDFEDSFDWNEFERDLMEYALCNGWTLDPDDDGRFFITQTGIDDNGQLDVSPGDLGWSFNGYVYRSWAEDLISNGEANFNAYYFGETSIDDQRDLP